MNQVLTQAEVDALLNAVADGPPEPAGKAAPKAASPSGASVSGSSGSASAFNLSNFGINTAEDPVEITPYDLTNQDRVIRGRMPTLDIIYERFVRLFRISLSNSLRKIASISIISTDLLKFGEFVNTLPIPSCMAILRLESLRGPGLLVFESKLAYALIDSYFGGTDRPYTKIEGKEFTRIELSIMQKVMEMAIKDLEDAWAPVYKVDISFLRTEVNPQFVGLVPHSDIVISTTFEVELENASGTVALVIPYSSIEPIKHKLNASFQTDTTQLNRDWAEKLEEHLRLAECDVVVNLGQTTINVGDLVNLNVGDVLPLGHDVDRELSILVEGVPKFKCFFGVSRGNRAAQITKAIEED